MIPPVLVDERKMQILAKEVNNEKSDSCYSNGGALNVGRNLKGCFVGICGNKWLRWAFIEAVTPAIRKSAMLRRYYDKIKA